MDWTPIDYNPQDRLDPGKCIAGHNAIADARETVYRTCPVMGSVEPACTMYREENGQWYRSKEPVTWGEMRIFSEGHCQPRVGCGESDEGSRSPMAGDNTVMLAGNKPSQGDDPG